MVFLIALFFGGSEVHAQVISLGSGSYRTHAPSGDVGPQNANGQSISPKISAGFQGAIQTNDFWSSLIFPFSGLPHSNVIFAHPLAMKAVESGLELGYSDGHVFAAADYLFPHSADLTVGIAGMTAPLTTALSYSDWVVTAEWKDGSHSMTATMGHGMPYVFFKLAGDRAQIRSTSSLDVWYQEDGTLGLTVSGKHYGIFAPSGSEWSQSTDLTSDLGGKDYLSVAVLPDRELTTLELFRTHAFAFVTDSRVTWNYDESSSGVSTEFSVETEVMEGSENRTLMALYRHQWLATRSPFLPFEYISARGTMKVVAGNTFYTEHPFTGILPALPNLGDYNPVQLHSLVKEATSQQLSPTDTYNSGKRMARFANLAHIADQLGADEERNYFLDQIKAQLEDWFTAGGALQYAYIPNWDVLTGYPSSFGADNQINDHHFHASYAIFSAATIARYDSVWAAPSQWGQMVNLLIRDANSWDRDDPLFPFLRSHDAYAGHSWAAGHADFGDGNNQESSSESLNFASAVILWGEATGQTNIRDLGVFLHATESAAVDQYWFDVDDAVFPEEYGHVSIGMVWGGKGVRSTWFGADPEFIHGINILPVTAGSLYLGRHPDYVLRNYAEIVEERSGQPVLWKDVLWKYLALGDADQALGYFLSDPGYEPFDGASKAHTMHWLFNLRKMGHLDKTVTANTPTYTVFEDAAGDHTYVAYNSNREEHVVTFSDGVELRVAPRSFATFTTADINPDAPVAIIQASTTRGKKPLRVSFDGNLSFDRKGGIVSHRWRFGNLGETQESAPVFTFEEAGEYPVVLEVTNGEGLQSSDNTYITVLENGTPFRGRTPSIPGRIQAEHYDEGGEGRAYHDAEEQNIGLAFRPDEGVDLEAANDGGHAVFWIVSGEWLEYTINVPTTGRYIFEPSVATVPGFGEIRLLIDGQDIGGWKPVTSTGSFQFWRSLPFPEVHLEEGTHILRVEARSDSDKTGWLFSLNHIDAHLATGLGSTRQESALSLALEQPWPYPASSSVSTTIMLPRAGRVRVDIIDILGRQHSPILDEALGEGRHDIRFDISTLRNGVYFIRLVSGSGKRLQPLVVSK